MREPLHPTPYADVNEVLAELLIQVQSILGEQFIGMYLCGSLALGDFDAQSSDIDLIIVTADLLPDDLFAALHAMHAQFEAGASPWATKIEAVYISQDALRRQPAPSTSFPQLEKERGLFLDQLEKGWIFQCYILRKHGVALSGPPVRTLLDPVDPDAMRRAVPAIPEMWLDDLQNDPTWLPWLRVRHNQAFVMLTLCRLLYTLVQGEVASKPAAARWAQQGLDARWAGLIERSLAGQHDDSLSPEQDVMETVALVEYTADRYRQWENSLLNPPSK